MTNTKIFITATMIAACIAPARALEYDYGKNHLRITGYGTAGIIEPDFDTPDFLGDWRVRAQINHDIGNRTTVGAVYALDAYTVDNDDYVDDAFFLIEDRNVGRMEIGLTESIAGKLGLGLPDVGAMRVNDNPLFYKKIHPRHAVIADGIIDTGDKSLRINIGTVQINGVQYGISGAFAGDDFDFAVDTGLKFRWPAGKFKAAMSLGTSFMDNPDNYFADPYAPRLTADWRAQAAWGMNMQYNSLVVGINARAIYDQDAIGAPSDGFTTGVGASYDILNYSVSLSYIMSDVGVWHNDVDDYIAHTVIASLRYKYSRNVDGWTSIGWTTDTPFLAAGLRLTF